MAPKAIVEASRKKKAKERTDKLRIVPLRTGRALPASASVSSALSSAVVHTDQRNDKQESEGETGEKSESGIAVEGDASRGQQADKKGGIHFPGSQPRQRGQNAVANQEISKDKKRKDKDQEEEIDRRMIDVGRLKRIGSHDQRVRHKVRILPGADDDVVFRQSEAIVKNRL